MSTELITNEIVREEMIGIYTKELSQNGDDDFNLYIATENAKILYQIKLKSGVYKGKEINGARNYFKGFSDAHTIAIKNKYIIFLVNQLRTNDTLSEVTKEYISSKIKVSYSQVNKIIRKLDRRKEKYGIK